jgi:signal transduction histidine kinase
VAATTVYAWRGSGPGRPLGVAGASTILVLGGLTVVGSVRTGVSDALVLLVTFVPAGLLGSVVVAVRPRHPVGWSFLGSSLLFLIGTTAYQWALLGWPGSDVTVWMQTWTYQVGLMPFFVLVPLYFPDGRLLSPRWRPVATTALVLGPLLGVVLALTPGDVQLGGHSVANPLGVLPAAPADALGTGLSLALVGLISAAAASLIARFRTAGREDRARLKLLAAAVIVTAAALVVDAAVALGRPEVYPEVFQVVQVVPVTIVAAAAVSVVRHRAVDVEQVLDRALLYTLLSASVLVLYVAIVALLRPVSPEAPVVSLVTAAVVAVALDPLRARLQRAVDRFVYGDRADPYRALALIGKRLEGTLSPDEALPAVVRAVADALRVPYVAIEVTAPTGGYATAAAQGSPQARDAEVTHVPLVHAGEKVGRLTLGPRGRRLELAPGDRRVLTDLARQVGVALHAARAAEHAVRLSVDLQRSRERLVLAREEERRRIGRDLHDGLGPQLAGISMTAEAARDLLEVDEERAGQLLDGLLDRADEAVHEVRRIAHLLRPPALSALGLVGALRSQAAAVTRPAVDMDVPELPTLPAAVEVAAYRIALEAVRNVAVHADATRCEVRLRHVGDALEVTVTDDGRGLPAAVPAGLGIASMIERAGELGGRCTLDSAPCGGTVVRAVLPCTAAGTEAR